MSMQLASPLGNENRMDSMPEKEISSECERKIDAFLQNLSSGEIDILYNKLKETRSYKNRDENERKRPRVSSSIGQPSNEPWTHIVEKNRKTSSK